MEGYLMDLGGWENCWEEEEMRLGKDYWAESEMEKTSVRTLNLTMEGTY